MAELYERYRRIAGLIRDDAQAVALLDAVMTAAVRLVEVVMRNDFTEAVSTICLDDEEMPEAAGARDEALKRVSRRLQSALLRLSTCLHEDYGTAPELPAGGLTGELDHERLDTVRWAMAFVFDVCGSFMMNRDQKELQ